MSPAPDDHQLSLFRLVVEAVDHDPFVEYDLDPGSLERAAVVEGLAAAWLSFHPWRQVRWITAVAAVPETDESRRAAVALVERLAEEAGTAGTAPTGITWPRSALALMPAPLRPPRHHEWDHWVTRSVPPAGVIRTEYDEDPPVVDLDASDPRIPQLLAVASPDAPIKPGDPRVVRWAGTEDGSGRLVTVVAVTAQRSGAGHLNDVATHPDVRGRGLARFLCGRVTEDALAEGRPAVTLGMYTDNDAARRLYTSLGFTCLHSFASGSLSG